MVRVDGGLTGISNLHRRLFAWFVARDGAQDDVITRHKRRLFAGLHGTVVEIGPGGGANLAYLPREAGVSWIGIERNPYMEPYLRAEARRLGLSPELRLGTAEHIDMPDGSADAVISTHVLCSVTDQQAILHEVLRILKPGGRFLFVEHVAAARGTSTRRRQNWVRPAWQLLGDGCQPNRETWLALETAGFTDLQYERFTLSYPIVGPHIAGVATR